MNRPTVFRSVIAAAALLALTLGCSTDSPTAPQQQPPGPPAPPSANWRITISVQPNELTAGSTDPAIVTVRVERVSDGVAPPSGTTIVVQTTLGDFQSLGSGISSVVLSLLRGRAEVALFAGGVTGSALVSAQLESSVGQKSVPIVEAIEPVVASFDTSNSNNDRSIVFRNTSTGNPTKFSWDFGDGSKSNKENPTHLYATGGDYVVSLTASKPGSSDTTSRSVAVPEDVEIVASFQVALDGLTAIFRDTSFGDPTSWRWTFGDGATSSLQNPTHVYGGDGTFVVTLTASKQNSSDFTSQTITISRELFIRLISPASGPPAGGTLVTITGQGFGAPLRVFFGGKLGDVQTIAPTMITVLTPPGDLPRQDCDFDGDGEIGDGTRVLDQTVSVIVELASGSRETIVNGFTYDTDNTCMAGAP